MKSFEISLSITVALLKPTKLLYVISYNVGIDFIRKLY